MSTTLAEHGGPRRVAERTRSARLIRDSIGLLSSKWAVDLLLAGKRRSDAYRPVSRFPASNVDLAFVVDDGVAAGAVLATLRAAAVSG